ncbi:hypothetical protein B566_EDAN003749 [Ephemera danica]|nr:hypothetical protein B566_EDAN003749 [Ephemera danica]
MQSRGERLANTIMALSVLRAAGASGVFFLDRPVRKEEPVGFITACAPHNTCSSIHTLLSCHLVQLLLPTSSSLLQDLIETCYSGMMATGACRAEELLRASCCSRLVADDDELHSPTDASEDSVEVKVLPILALSKKNKRKLAEPRKVPPDGKVASAAKRPRRAAPRVTELVNTPVPSPFRPWSETKPVPANEEPLSLVLRPTVTDSPSPALCGGKPTVPQCESLERRRTSSKFSVESLLGAESVSGEGLAPPRAPSTAGSSRNTGQHPVQRNYKNMTRERRIEANARERTRVHTISAAFDTLRRSIPAYSHSQKLSKLSILRIACSYIVALSRVNDMDYSEGQTAPSIAECVDQVTRTLHAEGKVRKKKDE